MGSLGALVLSAVFLAGPLAESHYLMLRIRGCLMVAMAEDRPARALLVGAVLVAAYPADAFPTGWATAWSACRPAAR